MKSEALAPIPAAVQAVGALTAHGVFGPLRPFASPWRFEGPTGGVAKELGVIAWAMEQLLRRWAQGTLGPLAPHLHPAVEEAARLDVERGRLLAFTRFDVVCPKDDPAAFSLLEVQAGDPSAMGWHDGLALAFHPHRAAGTPGLLMASHLATFTRRTDARDIAFLVAKGSIVESDHALLARVYSSAGWAARTVDPRELVLEGDRLLAGDRPVGAVFRDALDELVEGPFLEGGKALLEAHRKGLVAVLNPFAAALADDKGLLELLSTEEGWEPSVWRVLHARVPWTRRLAERRVDFEGKSADLLPLLRARKDDFVLKPCDGYGGFGVTVGRAQTQAEWEQALDAALSGPRPFVVQRHVPLPVQTVYELEGGEATPAERHVVHSLWWHGDRFAGAFMRGSSNPVVNVHQGGGLAPVFFSEALL